MIVIGIDPDLVKSGVCILKNGKIISLESKTFTQLINLIKNCTSDTTIAIENVEKNKTTFPRNTNQAVMKTIAQKVGMVKATARHIEEIVKDYTGKKAIKVPPGVGKATKKDAKLFNKLTGYTGRTNEDVRDAYWIADYAYRERKCLLAQEIK